MARIKLTLEYDGTEYVGWQRQPNGVSVQQRLEEALRALLGAEARVYSSGRTDAGVHARGMVCHFDSPRQLPLSAWREGVNRFLPADVVVKKADFVGSDFHARYSARGKCYRYSILRSEIPSPLLRHYVWQLRASLDLDLMCRASRLLVGRHDFAAFRTTGCSAGTTVREIYSIDLLEDGPLLFIDVCGTGFLKNMVRMLVGTMVEIGRGRRPIEDLTALLHGAENVAPALTAPAKGLCLMEVWY